MKRKTDAGETPTRLKRRWAGGLLCMFLAFSIVFGAAGMPVNAYTHQDYSSDKYFPGNRKTCRIKITGPSGTSWMDLYLEGPQGFSTTGTFNNMSRYLILHEADVSSKDTYKLKLVDPIVYTTKNANGNYINFSFQVKFRKPANEKYSSKEKDVPSTWTVDGFNAGTVTKTTSGKYITLTFHTDTHAFGLTTYRESANVYRRFWNSSFICKLQKA